MLYNKLATAQVNRKIKNACACIVTISMLDQAEGLEKLGGYLGDAFLNRVKRVYRSAIGGMSDLSVSIWAQINVLQKPVQAALLANDNEALRSIFANPVGSDLFYSLSLRDIPLHQS